MKKIFNKDGMSLLEILTVIAIIGIMSVIMMPQYSKYKKSKSLGLAKTQIMNDIRSVQSYTMTTFKFTDGSFPRGGYGIHFSAGIGVNSYIVFADKGTPDQEYDSSDEFFEEIELPEGIEINSLKVTVGGTTTEVSSVDFVSTPPYGIIYIDKQNKVGSSFVTLEIGYTNGSSEGAVVLVSSGSMN
ncbi:MAG: type II secretion system protein [Candidatus Pacebacteria bacterium]|nr:type II secretion system protein [Candidatus Paceibacterota bacterium]